MWPIGQFYQDATKSRWKRPLRWWDPFPYRSMQNRSLFNCIHMAFTPIPTARTMELIMRCLLSATHPNISFCKIGKKRWTVFSLCALKVRPKIIVWFVYTILFDFAGGDHAGARTVIWKFSDTATCVDYQTMLHMQLFKSLLIYEVCSPRISSFGGWIQWNRIHCSVLHPAIGFFWQRSPSFTWNSRNSFYHLSAH